MFNFTTTTVINSDTYDGKDYWTVETDKAGKKSFNVKRVSNFKADNITQVFKAPATEAENAKVTFNFTDITANNGDQLRITIYIGLSQSSNDSRYSNDSYFKGKPFTVDFTWNGKATDVVEKLVKTINKYGLLVYGEKILNVSYSGAYLTLEAIDEFQRFRKINVEKFDPVPHNGLGEYIAIKSLDNLNVVDSASKLTGTVEGVFQGKEGFGTASFFLRNLRLPTSMRTRAFGINQEENPISGAMYDQFTIHYCVNRGVMGTNAVGDIVTSATTHVFFVNREFSDDFEDKLAEVFENIVEVGANGPVASVNILEE